VTVNDVGVLPPEPAVTVTVTLPAPATPVGVPGIAGAATVVTEADEPDSPDVPIPFVAVILNVYAMPVVSPVTRMSPPPDWYTVPVPPGGFEIAVYEVIAEYPLSGARKLTFTVVGPAAIAPWSLGALGAVPGMTVADRSDCSDLPIPFHASASTVYWVPFLSPVTMQEPNTLFTLQDPA
jgi:hypothetical protein